MRSRIILKIVALVAIIMACSCHHKKLTEFKEIEVNGLYSLQMPWYLHSTDELMAFKSPGIQQYEDSVGKICLLVFDSLREDIGISTLRVFYDSMVANPVIDSAQITLAHLVKVDNDSTYQAEITGILNRNRVFSEIETIATPDRFYFIVAWAGLERRDELKPDMEKMLNSFKDISRSKK